MALLFLFHQCRDSENILYFSRSGQDFSKIIPVHQGERILLCYHCPDATIRMGKLTPVCLADQVSPLRDDVELPASAAEWSYIVSGHLGEN